MTCRNMFQEDYVLHEKLYFHHPNIIEFLDGKYTFKFIEELKRFVFDKETISKIVSADLSGFSDIYIYALPLEHVIFKELFNIDICFGLYGLHHVETNTDSQVLYDVENDIILEEDDLKKFRKHCTEYYITLYKTGLMGFQEGKLNE